MSDTMTSSAEVPVKKITLDTLPNELIFSIFSCLPAPSLASSLVALHCTSKIFNTILKTQAESLWITLCHNHGSLSFKELHAIHSRLYNISYRDLFTRFIYRYGYLIGIWFGDQRPHGDLLVIEWDLENPSSSEIPGDISAQQIRIKASRIRPLNTAEVPYVMFSQNPSIVVSNLRIKVTREPIFSITLSVLPPNQSITEIKSNISVPTICHEDNYNYDLHGPHNVRIARSTFRPHPKTGLWDQNREHNLFVDYYPLGLVNTDLFLDDEGVGDDWAISDTTEYKERAALREMVVDWAFNDAPATSVVTPAAASSNPSSSTQSAHGTHWSTSLLADRTPSFSLTCEKKPSDFCTNYARLPDQVVHPLHPSASLPNNHNLNGIWAGDYSSHGVEMIFLHTLRTTTSPNTVVALKLTGDSNVPRSEITWAAYMDERAIVRTCSEPEFNGKVAYRGWGQIAGLGFGGASFIDLEVILISNDELVAYFIRLKLFQRYHRLKL